jgi:zeaxanthin glucosyltransferase
MKRALVITLPEKGHYLPLIGPAKALQQRGFEVFFTAPADVRRELLESGAPQVILPEGVAPPSQALRGAALSAILRDPEKLRAWIRELLVEATEPLIEPLRKVIRDVSPQVVIIDTMCDAGAIAAAIEGVPWVGFATSLNPVLPDSLESDLLRTTHSLKPERKRLFARHGVDAKFRSSDVLSPRGTAVFTTEALVGPPPLLVELVGPSTRSPGELDRSFSEGRPLVYASFGSQAWHQPRRYEVLLEAAKQLDIALLLAMGELAEDRSQARVRCVRFADQLAALKAASVAVTHGGANSVMEALTYGVPMLISPLCNDQPHNLYFVAQAGAGRGLDLDTASTEAVVDSLKRLLGAGSERAAARRIAESYRRPGNEGAAALAERAAR